MLVGLVSVEERRFELDVFQHDAPRNDSKRNVRRIKPVMSNGSLWIVHARSAVHIGCRPQCRLTWQPCIDERRAAVAQIPRIRGRELHEEIMGMLTVDQRRAPVASL